MKRLLIFLIITVVFSSAVTSNQQVKKTMIKGKVLSSTDSIPLSKVIISVPSIRYGTITNVSGDFVLNIDTASIKSFVISKDGFKSRSIKIDNKKEFLILLSKEK